MHKYTNSGLIPESAVEDKYEDDAVIPVPEDTVTKDGIVRCVEEVAPVELAKERAEHNKLRMLEQYQNLSHIDDIIYTKTRIQAQKLIRKSLVRLSALGGQHITNRISHVFDDILEQLLSKRDIVLTLARLRSIDNYTYEHSVNVCVMALIIGIDMGLDKFSLKNLGLGAILHDVGKVGISEEILKKASRLTDYEFDIVKSHTEKGYLMLLNSNISPEAAQIALYHHERYDGTGYGRKMKGKEIPLLSRIVSIADAFDAMTNDRVYKKRLNPDKAYMEFAALGGTQFDMEITEVFIRRLDLYPVGTGIILNNSLKGVVVSQNKLLPERPCVRVFKKRSDSVKIEYVDVNLALTDHLYIIETF